MRSLFHIDDDIRAILENGEIDEATGEFIIDENALEALNMEREQKIENISIYYLELEASANALKEYKKSIDKRIKAFENKAVRVMRMVDTALAGEDFKTLKVSVKHTVSSVVDYDQEFLDWAKKTDAYLRYKEPEVDKVAIKAAIKSGVEVPHARLIDSVSVKIK